MVKPYNPIVRNFGRFRASLLRNTMLDRREVRPDSSLDSLLPKSIRRQVWRELHAEGFQLPALALSGEVVFYVSLLVLVAVVLSAFDLGNPYAFLLVFPYWSLSYWLSRPWALELPEVFRTVGELVLYATSLGEHKESGYRWTRNEITLKVRMIVADQTGLPIEKVQPETRLLDILD